MNEFDFDTPKDEIPHAPEGEQSLLGALLGRTDNHALFDDISHIVKAEDFYNPIHSQIFEKMETRFRRRQLVDPITMKKVFERADILEDIGGVDYLAVLFDMAAPGSSAVEYAHLVADMRARRAMMLFGEECYRKAKDLYEDASTDEIYEELKQGADALRAMISTTTVFKSMSDEARDEIEQIGMERKPGMSTGIAQLDESIGGLQRGDLFVLGARPRMGKSSLARNLMSSVCELPADVRGSEKPNILFFSLEMKARQIGMRAMSAWLASQRQVFIPYNRIMSHGVTAEERDLMLKELPLMKAAWNIQIDDTTNLTMTEIVSRTRAFKKKFGPPDLICLDYAQRMSWKDTSAANEHAGVNEALMRAADTAKDEELVFLMLSQLTRGVDHREGWTPQISDLRGSGGYEEHAILIAMLTRPQVYLEAKGKPEGGAAAQAWEFDMSAWRDKAELFMAKNKRGSEDKMTLHADMAHDRFKDGNEEPFVIL